MKIVLIVALLFLVALFVAIGWRTSRGGDETAPSHSGPLPFAARVHPACGAGRCSQSRPRRLPDMIGRMRELEKQVAALAARLG
jgi:hypothetical protein